MGSRKDGVTKAQGTNPINHYGVTKLEGEYAVMHAHPGAIVCQSELDIWTGQEDLC